MRLLRVGVSGHERPVASPDGSSFFDLSPLAADIDGAFLANGGPRIAQSRIDAGTLPETSIAHERIGAPIARPHAVVCIGMNYAAHAAESGSEPPANPVIFMKTPNTVVGPNDDLLLPPGAEKVDWEVELGVVIAKRARYLSSPVDAASVIAGYTISNDVSERAYQLEISGGQWSKGKCAETFNPLGPWLVTSDEIGAPSGLGLRTWINGELRQDSSTADMIFGVDELIWSLSQYMVLEPGDLVNTGTPQGVALSGRFPYLADGDIVTMSIDGMGTMRQAVKRAHR